MRTGGVITRSRLSIPLLGILLAMPLLASQAAAASCDALYLCPCAEAGEISTSQHSSGQTSGAMQAGSMEGMDMNHASTFIEEILAHNTAGTSAEPNSTPHDMLM